MDPEYEYVPGPLSMASIVLFGNNTFFDIASQAWNSSISEDSAKMLSGERLCNLVPFARLDPMRPPDTSMDKSSDRKFPGCETDQYELHEELSAREFLSKWLHGFNDTDTAVTALTTAVFIVNQAVVTIDQWSSRFSSESNSRDNYGRTIYSGFGTTIRKPQLSAGVTAAMSCILMLEVLSRDPGMADLPRTIGEPGTRCHGVLTAQGAYGRTQMFINIVGQSIDTRIISHFRYVCAGLLSAGWIECFTIIRYTWHQAYPLHPSQYPFIPRLYTTIRLPATLLLLGGLSNRVSSSLI
jgi:hypothetical protein